MSFRRARIAGSVVTMVYDDEDQAPAFQERRLEGVLRRLFPTGCGVAVVVDVAWSDPDSAWRMRRAQVDMGGVPVEITLSLAQSLRAAGTALVPFT